MQFWDTSSLLKLYVPEPDSGQFVGHVSAPPIYASAMTRWELFRAFCRKELNGGIPPQSAEAVFDSVLSDIAAGRLILLPVDHTVEARFRSLALQLHRRQPAIIIRTLDAIHLATAELLPAAEVIATDRQVRAAATAIGMSVFP